MQIALPVLLIIVNAVASGVAVWTGIATKRKLPAAILGALLVVQVGLAVVVERRASNDQAQRDAQSRKNDDLSRQLSAFIQLAPSLSQAGTDSILARIGRLERTISQGQRQPAATIEGLALAKKLLQFADERDKSMPGEIGTQVFGQGMFGGAGDPNEVLSHNDETLRLYREQFASEILALENRFGVKLAPEARVLTDNPGSTLGIRRLAELLVAASDLK